MEEDMEKNDLTRSYLETLSSTDLIALGDDYGLEIENLSRGFVITEILDSLEKQISQEETFEEEEVVDDSVELPFSYNENRIVAVLRNPAWCYVTWDFKQESFVSISNNPNFDAFTVRFSYHENTQTDSVDEVFEIQINFVDKEQFVLLSSDYTSFHASLVANFSDGTKEILATSQRVYKPKIPIDINLATLQKTCDPIQTLSGLPSILKSHYNEHRHSFVRD